VCKPGKELSSLQQSVNKHLQSARQRPAPVVISCARRQGCYLCSFTEAEIEAQGVSDLPKVTPATMLPSRI
jgi:hypothetical protein